MPHLLDPTLAPLPVTPQREHRALSLQGRRIGLLDNGKAGAAELLAAAGEIFRREFGVAEVRMVRKPDMSRPAPQSVLDALRDMDAALTGVGD